MRKTRQKRAVEDRLGLLTERLLTALDEAQIFQVLAEELPEVGIQHAAVVFFEPEGDNPAAWSLLQAVPGSGKATLRFPSREFPPVGLYPTDRPFSLAILPLVDQEEEIGFVALDSGNLDLCGAIVQQLAAALRIARLYHEATEGRPRPAGRPMK